MAGPSRTMSITIIMTFNWSTFKYCIYIKTSQVACSVCIRVSSILVVLLPGKVGLSMTEIRKWNEKCSVCRNTISIIVICNSVL
jgi:hypothetical protein